MRKVLLGTTFAIALAALTFTPASAKTAKECNAEYAANKAAIKSVQKKADFIAACKAGTEVVPGAATAAPAPAAPAPSPAQTAAPAPAPAVPVTRAAPAAAGANEFTTDAQAKARCPSDTVVWVNTHSHIYHFAGHRDYGNTKSGAYMCEADANAAGNRAPKNEKHP